MKKITFLLLLLVQLTAMASAGNKFLAPGRIVEGKFLTRWLLLGPFPLKAQTVAERSWEHLPGYLQDWLATSGGETNLVARDGDPVKVNRQTLHWKYAESTDSVMDLCALVSKAYPVMAYAYTEVETDASTVHLIGLGSNDGGTLYVNGKQVWDYPGSRGLKVDGDLIPVVLQKGVNRILLKIEQHGNKWGFCFRFHKFSASDAFERGDLFHLRADESGIASLGSAYLPEVLENIISKVDFTVKGSRGNTILSEERPAPFCGPVNIPVPHYQHYSAGLNVQLKSGEILHRDLEFTAGKRTDYSLFKGGKSEYRISLAPGASESEQWAARELQQWLAAAGGAELPLLPEDPAYKGKQIIIGRPDPHAGNGETGPEAFHYFNEGADIWICGGKQRGTMYGVFEFLEKELGCRWYTPSVEVIPKRDEVKFNWLDHSGKPGVRVRNDFYFEAFDPVWAARNRMNGAMGYRVQPGDVESYWAVHTFYPLMPPEEFYRKHPEYYSLIDGKRVWDHAQLCLTNPDVLRIITERIRKRMRESPEYLIYDVSQNDWRNPCQCSKCQAVAKAHGGESGVIIWFVNQVAEAVEKEFPDKFIGTLAYQYTRTPPKDIKPRQNVVVRLCSIECCFAHDFKSCPENKSFLEDLKGWSAIAPHMYIWDYVVNFSHYVMPYPNFRVLQSNIRTFRDNNAIGIMEQAAYQSRGGEFSELRSYLISKLLWNPECNTEDVINDFIYGYYGRAGKFVRQYFDLLHNRLTPDTHIHLGLTPGDLLFTDEFVRQACSLFDEAVKVADNDEVVKRVEMCSLPVLYLKCRRTPTLALQDGSYKAFCRIAEREKVLNISEGGEADRKAFHFQVENAK